MKVILIQYQSLRAFQVKYELRLKIAYKYCGGADRIYSKSKKTKLTQLNLWRNF